MITNYKDFKKYLLTLENKPSLLLHSCCAPCSSHTLIFLKEYFEITIFFDNSNIHPEEEYSKRLQEQIKLCNILGISIIHSKYRPQEYFDNIKGLEHLGEFSERCFKCYEFRMINSFNYALENNFDYFTTTLSISPYKNSDKINEIGYKLENDKTKFLYSNFKKDMGYQNSIKLSKEFDLYRQHYCGCIYSKKEMLEC
ncbi:MAG: epoxyqueuosine reductase QueH [bacterium]